MTLRSYTTLLEHATGSWNADRGEAIAALRLRRPPLHQADAPGEGAVISPMSYALHKRPPPSLATLISALKYTAILRSDWIPPGNVILQPMPDSILT